MHSAGTVLSLASMMAMSAGAADYPRTLLNAEEIAEVGRKAGQSVQPWRSAYEEMIRTADQALSHSGWNTRNLKDHTVEYSQEERELYRQFGHALTNVALARHLTGNRKYSDRATQWIDRFFFDPSTYLKPDYKGDVVGSNGLCHVFYGVDLIMPFLDSDRQRKLREWMQDFTNDIGNGEFGGIGGQHNRADWSVAAAMMSALIAGDDNKARACFEHVKLRRLKSTGQLDGVGGATNGQWDKEVSYNFFAMNGLMVIAEAARHHGVDLYSHDVYNGTPKVRRMLDFYAGWAYVEPKSTGGNSAVYELAYAVYGDPRYLSIVDKVGRPINLGTGDDRPMHCIFGPLTLTHSRGSYFFGVDPGTPVSPTPADTPTALPGRIEAEDYAAMHGVGTEATDDAGGGMNVGWVDPGDWLEYGVIVESEGTHTFAYRVASPTSGGGLELLIDGESAHTVNIPNTGGWQNWTTINATAALRAGTHTLRITVAGSDWNLNYMEVSGPGTTAAAPLPSRDPQERGLTVRGRGAMVRFDDVAPGEPVRLWGIDGRLLARTRADGRGAGMLRSSAPAMAVFETGGAGCLADVPWKRDL